MGIYYDYYLEKKDKDGWHRLSSLEDGSSMIYYHRSYGYDFVGEYEICELSFNDYCVEAKKNYAEKYEQAEKDNALSFFYPRYCELSIELMFQDFDNGIHEYAGIIKKNDRLKIERNPEYIPDMIDEADFNKLPEEIKDNYIFYAWDSPWSEYGHIYDLVPIIRDMLKYYDLTVSDVRLICSKG